MVLQHVSQFLVYFTSCFLTFDNKYCCTMKTANPNNYICSPKACTGKSIFDVFATPSLQWCSIALVHYTLRSIRTLNPLSSAFLALRKQLLFQVLSPESFVYLSYPGCAPLPFLRDQSQGLFVNPFYLFSLFNNDITTKKSISGIVSIYHLLCQILYVYV